MTDGLKKNERIFVRDYKLPDDGTENMKKMITVVPSALWLMLTAGIILLVMFVIWAIKGQITQTISANGIYHPGAATCGEVISFVPIVQGKNLSVGMNATLYPSGKDQQEYGHMKGTITYVDPYVCSVEGMRGYLGDDSVVNVFLGNGPVMTVVIDLTKDEATTNGFYWSNKRGGDVTMNDGTWMSISIETNTLSPLEYAFPDIGEYN